VLEPAELPAQVREPIATARLRHLDDDAVPGYPPVRRRIDASQHRHAEAGAWQAWLSGTAPLHLPAHTVRRAIIDLDDYHCFDLALTAVGAGAQVRILAAEALCVDHSHPTRPTKAHRDLIDGLEFVGSGPLVDLTAQARTYAPWWWLAGRYLEVTVATGAAGCRLDRLALVSTRYPLERADRIEASEPRLAPAMRVMTRALQMCAHETWMDCPYYEQLAYIGDTRLECLATFAIGGDDRICRAALGHFARARLPDGTLGARAPSRWPQAIPPFSLYWIGMLHDQTWWRDPALGRHLLPVARGIAEAFVAATGDDGVPRPLPGWNYVDWVPGWVMGMPPTPPDAYPAVVRWQLVYALALLAELEEAVGEPEPAARWRRHAARIAARLDADTWDHAAGVWADAPGLHLELTQAFAILSGCSPAARARQAGQALAGGGLVRATISASHYVLEALGRLGAGPTLAQRLADRWYGLPELGLRTTPEMDEPSRSDCHAWGAHPLYHLHATVLGVRPAQPGFRSVRIAPCLGVFDRIDGELPHPAGGRIRTTVTRDEAGWTISASLPPSLTGLIQVGDLRQPLAAGGHGSLRIPRSA
jgi:hypothetical protein